MDGRRIETLLELVLELLVRSERREKRMANEIARLEAAQALIGAKVDAIVAQIGAGGLAPADAARINAVSDALEAKAAELATVIAP